MCWEQGDFCPPFYTGKQHCELLFASLNEQPLSYGGGSEKQTVSEGSSIFFNKTEPDLEERQNNKYCTSTCTVYFSAILGVLKGVASFVLDNTEN